MDMAFIYGKKRGNSTKACGIMENNMEKVYILRMGEKEKVNGSVGKLNGLKIITQTTILKVNIVVKSD